MSSPFEIAVVQSLVQQLFFCKKVVHAKGRVAWTINREKVRYIFNKLMRNFQFYLYHQEVALHRIYL